MEMLSSKGLCWPCADFHVSANFLATEQQLLITYAWKAKMDADMEKSLCEKNKGSYTQTRTYDWM